MTRPSREAGRRAGPEGRVDDAPSCRATSLAYSPGYRRAVAAPHGVLTPSPLRAADCGDGDRRAGRDRHRRRRGHGPRDRGAAGGRGRGRRRRRRRRRAAGTETVARIAAGRRPAGARATSGGGPTSPTSSPSPDGTDGPRVARQQRGRRRPRPAALPRRQPGRSGAPRSTSTSAAPMLATQLALEPMRRAGGGAIVNVASTAGLGPRALPVAGVRRREGRAHPLHVDARGLRERMGVRVNCVVPDWVPDRARRGGARGDDAGGARRRARAAAARRAHRRGRRRSSATTTSPAGSSCSAAARRRACSRPRSTTRDDRPHATVNLHTPRSRRRRARGLPPRLPKLAPLIGARDDDRRLYELPPGRRTAPTTTSPTRSGCSSSRALTVRHPEGEDVLGPGDLVCFPAGPDGAHKLTNTGDEPVRVLLVSTANLPAVAVYPDSDKIGVWTEGRRDNIMVRREAGVDYYDGRGERAAGSTSTRAEIDVRRRRPGGLPRRPRAVRPALGARAGRRALRAAARPGNCPYHYESATRSGCSCSTGALDRAPSRRRGRARPGRPRLLPGRPDGAHKLTNSGEETGRMLIVLAAQHCRRSRSIPTATRSACSPTAGANVMVRRATRTSTTATARPSAARRRCMRRTPRRSPRPGRRRGAARGRRRGGGSCSQLGRAARLGGALTAPLRQRHTGRDVALDVVDLAHRAHCAPIIGWNGPGPERETRILRCACPTSASPNTCATRAGAATSPRAPRRRGRRRRLRRPRPALGRASRATASRDAGFEASGCGATIAAAQRRGRARRAARRSSTPPASDSAAIAAELGGLSAGKLHAADLAADALHRALGAAARAPTRALAPRARPHARRHERRRRLRRRRAAAPTGEVVAVTLELWRDPENDGERSCCSADAVRGARALAHRMGLRAPHARPARRVPRRRRRPVARRPRRRPDAEPVRALQRPRAPRRDARPSPTASAPRRWPPATTRAAPPDGLLRLRRRPGQGPDLHARRAGPRDRSRGCASRSAS